MIIYYVLINQETGKEEKNKTGKMETKEKKKRKEKSNKWRFCVFGQCKKKVRK